MTSPNRHPPENNNTLINKDGEKMEDDEEVPEGDALHCGIGSCRPGVLQCCATMGAFSAAYSFSGLLTSTLSIYITSQITTLEKQFGFSSSISGFILSCNDIGYLLTTLFMSYIARRTHIPRVLGLSTIFFGLSGIVCSIPYFVTKDDLHPFLNTSAGGTSVGQSFGGPMCLGEVRGNMSDACSSDSRNSKSITTSSESMRTLAVVFLAAGMMLQGFGKSPRYPFLATYVDDNVDKTRTTLYLGIITGLAMFGPALGFILGGVFSRIYVTLEETSLSPRDPRWIGAWWLGFLVFGLLSLMAALPLFLFPRHMGKSRDLTVNQEKKRRETCCLEFQELLRSLVRLVRTPIYMCLVLGNCLTLFAISGMFAFLPKYIEVQFHIPAWKANMMLGAMNVIGAVVGTMSGGILTTKLKLRPVTCLTFVLSLALISVVLSAVGFFTGCPEPDIVGYNAGDIVGVCMRCFESASQLGYFADCQNHCRRRACMASFGRDAVKPADCDWFLAYQGNESLSCASTCGCADSYFPVCGENGLNYFSPCHAGCLDRRGMMFTNCTCIPDSSTAGAGLCESRCNFLYPYLAAMFLTVLLGTLAMMPGFNATIRSVPEKDKPLAVGLSAFLNTLLGWFPGPISFGKLIDTTCLIWTSSCSGTGACALYSLVGLKVKYHVLFVVTRVFALVLYMVAFVMARRSKTPFHGVATAGTSSLERQGFIVKRQ